MSPDRRRMSGLLDFSSTHTDWHLKRFIRSVDLDSLCLKADCFQIRCDVTVVLETRDESSVLPSPDLHRHLGNMLASGVGGDVTFEVDKNVLAARSPVFMAEFFGGMMEEKAAAAVRVRIIGVDARAFKAMLHFIYTDSLPKIDEDDKIPMAQHLLVAADRYNVQRLKQICENKLCIFVEEDPNVAATTLVLAEQHGWSRLKEACLKRLRSNFEALRHDEYRYLMRSCRSLFDKLLAERGL